MARNNMPTLTSTSKGSLFRSDEWLLSKIAPIMGIVYLTILCLGWTFSDKSLLLFLALVTAVGFGAFGFFLNDVTDMELDRATGKFNSASAYPSGVRILLILVFLSMALFPWIFLPRDNLSLVLLVAQILAFVTYSVRPFRFKESPYFSIVTDALYAHAIPVVLAFHTFALITGKNDGLLLLSALFLWQFLSGIRYFLNHLALGVETDRQNGIRTVAVKYGNQHIYTIISRYILPLEIACFIIFMAFIPSGLRWVLLGISIILLLLNYILSPTIAGINPFVFFRYSFKQTPIDYYYQRVFPVFCLGALAILEHSFLWLLFAHLLIFFYQDFYRYGLLFFRKPLSVTVNYSIYYIRKYVLFYDERKARGDYYEAYLTQKEKKEMATKNGSVAIVNINKDKYTETFVKGHIEQLPGATYFYYGGDFPLLEQHQGELLDMSPIKVAWRSFLSHLFRLPTNFYTKKAFVASLKKNKVKVILAEFGTVGANLVHVAEETGIPLVVIFYGYDAYRKDVLENNKDLYRHLFKVSGHIIAVSTHMKTQLEKLGAPGEKTTYLPCYIDLSRFHYSDHSHNEPVFLSVGRFAETKSPHLTILAFNKVLLQYPTAKLVMVGKDGGGELFEACHILVKALKIEGRVIFRGILTPDEVYNEMKSAFVFIQHSVTTPIYGDSEGTPVAIMESLASGLPVISTRHAGIMDMIQDGENGYLVDEYDMDGMAQKMIDLLNDRVRAQQMGMLSSRRIRENGLVNSHIEVLWKILQKEMK